MCFVNHWLFVRTVRGLAVRGVPLAGCDLAVDPAFRVGILCSSQGVISEVVTLPVSSEPHLLLRV